LVNRIIPNDHSVRMNDYFAGLFAHSQIKKLRHVCKICFKMLGVLDWNLNGVVHSDEQDVCLKCIAETLGKSNEKPQGEEEQKECVSHR